MPLVLASSSAIRRAMLESAGVGFSAVAANLDESVEKARLDEPGAIAAALAKAKAVAVSAGRGRDWVIGSDSVASVSGRLLDKPKDRDQAADHLHLLSGKTMRLTSAVALARGGRVDWSFCDEAVLRVRPLSETFIDCYLDCEWPEVAQCVGAFRLEGLGVQLFETIEGSYFTILGMPLLPLLGALRERGVVES